MCRWEAALAFTFVFPVQSPAAPAADLPAEARRLIEVLELGPGDSVADLGAGSGELSVEVARQLGPDAIFLRSVYYHFAEPPTMNAAIARALEPGGRRRRHDDAAV